ncbi:MAG TPA: glycosyltransferase [Terriglobia bacterium]|nr:glycosyltransferase [Terriglobia bacterium]
MSLNPMQVDLSARTLENAVDAVVPELSVVIPCLNEAETIHACIDTVQRVFRELAISGEIIVADNGSVDGSPDIASRMGARVIRVKNKGYGNALQSGIGIARGRYVITGDADGSHDFGQIPEFLAKLREGYDVVIGNRFHGKIHAGAMPPLHRYVGTPLLTQLGKLLFHSPCGDQQCGFRGFSRKAFSRMSLRAPGMEFASEMVLKAACLRLRIAELPTTHFPSGRRGPRHLRTWRDGWRHLRLMLLHSPRWLFFYPGLTLVVAGMGTGAWLLPGPKIFRGITFDIHTLLYAGTAVLLGFQALTFAAFSKLYAIREGLLPDDTRIEQLLRAVSLEVGLVVGGVLAALGLALSIYALGRYSAAHFGTLDPVKTMRLVIPAAVSLALGGQTVLSSFLLSLLLLPPMPERWVAKELPHDDLEHEIAPSVSTAD